MSGQTEVKRSVRFGDRVHSELMDLILRGAVREPAAQGALIVFVRVTEDLALARVYVRHQNPAATPTQRKGMVVALKKAKGFLRHELSQRLQVKHTPDLEFFWDEGMDNALRVDDLLSEIQDEIKKKPETP